MADPGYRIAPIFLIRMAGVPFEILEQLTTGETCEAARKFITAEADFSRAKSEVEQILASRKHNLSKDQFRAWRMAILHGVMPSAHDVPSSAFGACWESATRFAEAEAALDQSLQRELDSSRRSLMQSARRYLPGYLVFAGSGLRDLIAAVPDAPLPPRKKSLRARERHLLLYLQRICGKNDTLSEYGPQSWGRAEAAVRGVQIAPQPGIARRETFLERWTAQGVAAAINADLETAAEIAPRLHPLGRIDGDEFTFTESGETQPIAPQITALLKRCDSTRPAHSLGVPLSVLHDLVRQKFLQWEMEVPALEPHAFDLLLDEVRRWRETPVRARWLEQLQPIATLSQDFARVPDPRARLAMIDEAVERLANLGAHKSASRFLYSATNPIGEECFRESNFRISQKLLDEVTTEIAPWIDLWRDNYAFVASRVAAGLRAILEQVPLKEESLPLPEFLRRCVEAKMPLNGAGMVALAHLAFRETKEAFRESLGDRAQLRECELTEADYRFVRQNFSYEKFDECTYPSADLQLAAASLDAVARGDYQWILAELHPPVALLHHGFYWSCPDKPALREALERTLHGRPYLYYGYFAADFTATTAVRLDALPAAIKFVAPQRSAGNWQTFRPAETEVFIDESGDVGVRTRGAREYLGSFARGWVIPLGFHPFSFSLGAHTPRLRCGKVIVQREAWTVTLEELGQADFTGISRDLVVAVEKLRAARSLPRQVYIRPTERALRRAGVEGRDKDTKPVLIDFESYLFLEIFHRWLTKAGELEVTEMLPTPEQLLWQEADGRRTFELRTQIIPR